MQGFFSITFDYWRGINADGFLGITYHIIDKMWKVSSFILDLVYTPGKKYGVHIAKQVKTAIRSHENDECLLVSSVTDKAENVKLASQILCDDDAKYCFNHELKKVVDDALVGTDATPASAAKAKRLMAFISTLCEWIRTDKAEKRVFESLQDG